MVIGEDGDGCEYNKRARVLLQVVVVPLRVNVNLKAVTVKDLVARRKVRIDKSVI